MATMDEVRETYERYLAAFVANDLAGIETVFAFYAFTRTTDGWKLYALSDLVNPAT
jgi:hypothetical protein